MRTCPKCSQSYPDDSDYCPKDGTALPPTPPGITEAALTGSLARRYRIVKKLSAGGMGSVFLAEQITLGNRPVALKVLSRKLLDDPEFLLRFHDEGASTARIRHLNVVTIYESGQADDGTPYIAMEFLDGETLRDALRRRGGFPVSECAEILQQAARGLGAAHKLGIIHRDLKPDNLFLTRGDEGELIVKVVDFGIAKVRESHTHTTAGKVLGTLAYMSSEQAFGMRSDELDARSDVYSLGIVAYEMLVGRVPFHSDTPLGYVRKHMLEDPPPFRAVAPSISFPAQTEMVVMKALLKNRELRYATAVEFAREFARAAKATPPGKAVNPFATTKKSELEELSGRPSPSMGLRAASSPLIDATAIVGVSASPGLRWPAPQAAVQTPPPLLVDDTVRAEVTPSTVPTSEESVSGQEAQPELRSAPNSRAGRSAETRQARDSSAVSYNRPDSEKKARAATKIFVAGLAMAVMFVLIWVFWPSRPNGEGRQNPKDGLNYVWVSPGTFMMGCSPGDGDCFDEEKPAHQVMVTRGFWIGQTPVTVGAYSHFAGTTGRQMPPAPNFNKEWKNQEMPIVNVSWDDAQAYCGWTGGRLPTEAEWEYAAWGGNTEARYGILNDIAWYNANSGGQTHEVGHKRANGFGLYDVLGNVWEWVNDWYDDRYYRNSPSQDPEGPGGGQLRVLRGGSWLSEPKLLRVSFRQRNLPANWGNAVGFRCGGKLFRP